MEPVKVAIIYYSATGTVHALVRAAAGGAAKAGAVDTVAALKAGRVAASRGGGPSNSLPLPTRSAQTNGGFRD